MPKDAADPPPCGGGGESDRSKHPPEIPRGTRLAGRYRIERELGRGGIGAVFLARDQQMDDRPVVVKLLLDRTTGREWVYRKFRDEIRALVRLDHPSVVGALDAGTLPDGQPFLVMEYVPGITLHSRMKTGPMSLKEVADIVEQAGRALTAAHERGIYHRDLKPQNIMLQDLGHGQRLVKIIDFGMATVREVGDTNPLDSQVAGTPAFMAPEQLMGKPTAASDIYGLAVIAYQMITGRLPFQSGSVSELMPRQQEQGATLPSMIRTEVLPECDASLVKALSFDSKDRHPSARQFAEELATSLRRAAEHSPDEVSTAPLAGVPLPSTVTPVGLRSRRAGSWFVGALAVAVALGVGITLVRRETFVPSPPPTLAPARVLTYSLMVQKYRDGRPYREPFRLPGEMLFGVDDRIRVLLSSPQAGHLYIVNQGPVTSAGSPSYNILFPTESTRTSAEIGAREPIQIPARSWFVFDEQEGTERLWLIWSTREVPELETVKHLANPDDQGRISDPAQVAAIQRFLAARSAPRPKVIRDESGQVTRIEGNEDVLVNLLKLEHH